MISDALLVWEMNDAFPSHDAHLLRHPLAPRTPLHPSLNLQDIVVAAPTPNSGHSRARDPAALL